MGPQWAQHMRDDRIDEALTKEYRDTSNKLVSVLEMNDLEALMHEADLAGRDFEAENAREVSLITTGILGSARKLTEEERREQLARMASHAAQLQIPRRPPWNAATTKKELYDQEKGSFLQWRKNLAELETDELLVLSPFEKNLEVWRQLWRVVERSDVVVQIVDARNPEFFRCPDFESYV